MLNEYIFFHPYMAYAFYALVVLCIGSVLNVIIYRLPILLKNTWRYQCSLLLEQHPIQSPVAINLWFPRSFCPYCKKTIPAWHMLPLLSYCFLGGQCHHCHQRISFRYPLVEWSCLCLSSLALWSIGYQIILLPCLFFIWLLICLFFIDLDHQILPDELTISLLWLGLIVNIYHTFTPTSDAILGAVGGYLILWGIMKIYYFFTTKKGMGNGDFKLFAALGAWFGWTLLPFILFTSSLIGAIIGTIYLKYTQKAQDTPLPFGPYLCITGIVSLFYRDTIFHWYSWF